MMIEKQEEAARRYAQLSLLDEETMSMLKELSAGNPEIFTDILDSFEPEADTVVQEIKKAVLIKDTASLRTASHSLAGISGSIGALRLRHVCSDTENAIKAGNNDAAIQNATFIFTIYAELIEKLKNF
jgi:HPt (histidine-containing phosphotransfer) domain-containing protein